MNAANTWTDKEDYLILNKRKFRESWISFREREMPWRDIRSIRKRALFFGLKGGSDWTNEEDELIKLFYLTDLSAKELEDKIPNRTYFAIRSRANYLGLRRETYNTYVKNDSFFGEPNEINCSIAGFIGADGNIRTEECKKVVIKLSKKDFNFLEKVRIVFGYTGPIKNSVRLNQTIKAGPGPFRFYPRAEFSTLAICKSDKWILDLKKFWNITERKTYTLQPPNITDLNLCLAYICGLINGDGCITISKCKYKCIHINIAGTEPLLIWVKSVYERFLGYPIKNKILKRENIFSLTINGLKAAKIINYINTLDCVFLERKWKKESVLKRIEEWKEKLPLEFT